MNASEIAHRGGQARWNMRLARAKLRKRHAVIGVKGRVWTVEDAGSTQAVEQTIPREPVTPP